MDNQPRSHLKIEGYNENLPFKYPKEAMGTSKVAIQNRTIHGKRLSNQQLYKVPLGMKYW